MINEIDGTLELGPLKIPLPRPTGKAEMAESELGARQPGEGPRANQPDRRIEPPDLTDVPSVTNKRDKMTSPR